MSTLTPRRLLVLGGLTTLLAAPLALARPPGHGHGHGEHHEASPEARAERVHEHLAGLLDAIEATPAQREAITGIVDSALAQMPAMHTAMKEARDQLRLAVEADASDETIREKRAAVGALHEAVATARTERALAVRKVLDDTQWDALRELKGAHLLGVGEGPPPGHGPPEGHGRRGH
ncbi:MAG: Spy/CpxP family protein refolding chaperone [Alphaproteobacteria bacterium]|nr:Spy/CpxP family protein refolding chaperone [Alphaproteobacteria bacterium]